MVYSKDEMRDMLVNCIGIEEDDLYIMLKLIGDTPQSYIKILTAASDYTNFIDVENDNIIEGCV